MGFSSIIFSKNPSFLRDSNILFACASSFTRASSSFIRAISFIILISFDERSGTTLSCAAEVALAIASDISPRKDSFDISSVIPTVKDPSILSTYCLTLPIPTDSSFVPISGSSFPFTPKSTFNKNSPMFPSRGVPCLTCCGTCNNSPPAYSFSPSTAATSASSTPPVFNSYACCSDDLCITAERFIDTSLFLICVSGDSSKMLLPRNSTCPATSGFEDLDLKPASGKSPWNNFTNEETSSVGFEYRFEEIFALPL